MTTKPNGNGTSMTDLVKQQSVIWVRIIITILIIAAGKFVWNMNTTMVKMASNTETIARDVSTIAKKMETMAGEIKVNTANIGVNKTNIAVNKTNISNLKGKHD